MTTRRKRIEKMLEPKQITTALDAFFGDKLEDNEIVGTFVKGLTYESERLAPLHKAMLDEIDMLRSALESQLKYLKNGVDNECWCDCGADNGDGTSVPICFAHEQIEEIAKVLNQPKAIDELIKGEG